MPADRPIFYVHTPQDAALWQNLLATALPECQVMANPAEPLLDRVRYLASWQAPAGLFARFPNLEAVFALGAGVDKVVHRADLAPQVALIRLTDAGMAQQMLEYVLAGVLRFQRHLDCYAVQQQQRQWQPLPERAAADTRITVLGLGEMGGRVASGLAGLGYAVAGWSRTARTLDKVRCRHGLAALDDLLAATDILVNILPNTPATRGLLNQERLARLPAGAALINAGRGEQLDETALLAMLDSGHLRGAMLDVLAEEPPASSHPFWNHPKIVLTPHIAAKTLPAPAVQQIADKLRAWRAGLPVAGLLDRNQAY